MRAYELKSPPGAHKKRKRVGRGNSSGHGTYSGKGIKGQKARSGGGPPGPWFEGGQTRIVKRMPELRGFVNNFRTEYAIVNVGRLDKVFPAGAQVTLEALVDAGIIANQRLPVKVLGEGDLNKALTIQAHKFSASAKSKIAAAGGQAEEITGA